MIWLLLLSCRRRCWRPKSRLEAQLTVVFFIAICVWLLTR